MFRDCHASLRSLVLPGLLLYWPCHAFVSPFLAASLLVPALIMVSLRFLAKLPAPAAAFVVFLGRHTLEIYAANLLVCWTLSVYTFGPVARLALYAGIQLLGSALLIAFNRLVRQKN